jgi:hypothetical protein
MIIMLAMPMTTTPMPISAPMSATITAPTTMAVTTHDDDDRSVLLRVFKSAVGWAARAPSTAARSKIPCFPLRVTARSPAQPVGSAFRKH